MADIFVSVQVPEGDVDDLRVLSAELGGDVMQPISTHPFDGVALMQIVFPLGALTAAVLRHWMTTRKEARKSMRVVVDGMEISGYTAAELEKVLNKLVDQPAEHRPEVEGGTR